MARELYIYWRVAAGQDTVATAAARELQAGLRLRHPGLTARLLVRDDGPAASHEATLMEVYQHEPAGVDAALQAAIDAATAVLQPFSAGPRHVEVFEALPR